jgi:hypothetical protein
MEINLDDMHVHAFFVGECNADVKFLRVWMEIDSLEREYIEM